MTLALVRRDERALNQRIEPAAILALLFLTAPAAAALAWSFSTWEGAWVWPTRVVLVVWLVLWIGVGVPQIWTEHTDADGDEQSARA